MMIYDQLSVLRNDKDNVKKPLCFRSIMSIYKRGQKEIWGKSGF